MRRFKSEGMKWRGYIISRDREGYWIGTKGKDRTAGATLDTLKDNIALLIYYEESRKAEALLIEYEKAKRA